MTFFLTVWCLSQRRTQHRWERLQRPLWIMTQFEGVIQHPTDDENGDLHVQSTDLQNHTGDCPQDPSAETNLIPCLSYQGGLFKARTLSLERNSYIYILLWWATWNQTRSEKGMYLVLSEWVAVAEPCLTLCDPMDCSLAGFSIHGILQARILEWVAISFSST